MKMSGKIALCACLLAFLAACGKEPLQAPEVELPSPEDAPAISFHLSASHGEETRAVKTAWEDGDVILVFFSGVAAPAHLRLSFAGGAWTALEMNGASAGSLGLRNGDSGTMRALFLPFGSGVQVHSSGTSFTFSETHYSYYLSGSLDYAVTENTVSGNFSMSVPDGYVQFYVTDAAAADGTYALGTDAVVPVGVLSVSAGGDIVETSGKLAGDDMPGYAYQGGYLFSGKLVDDYAAHYGGNYYFAKTKLADGSREDYFVTGKTLVSNMAVKLPAHGSGRWVAVGPDEVVELGGGFGTWYTCNKGATLPEGTADVGEAYADARQGGEHRALPSSSLLFSGAALKDGLGLSWLPVHGQEGMVLSTASGFIFLPGFEANDMGWYWFMRVGASNYRSFMLFNDSTLEIDNASTFEDSELLVRYIWKD